MKNFLLVLLISCLGGCAFYQKDYVSKIYLEGKNYPGGDEGQFYIHNDPLIRISFGCYKKTQLSATVFPLIPLPSFNEAEPHDSIAGQQLYMVLTYNESPHITPDTVSATININGIKHTLGLDRVEKVPFLFPRYQYTYTSELKCGDIPKGDLYIELNDNESRHYRIEFREGVQRDLRYHLTFAT